MENKILKYSDFSNNRIRKYLENISSTSSSNLPTYEDCVDMCQRIDSPFYETKLNLEGFPISIFNYRLASSSDFNTPASKEMRGLTFVFNKDGSLYKRFLLLEKFFNLNQVPESMYSSVKDLKIKSVMNKEDGSIASFIKLPNGKILGKSKMGFDNDQANGINRVYRTNRDIKNFVDWTLNNNICAIFEYVSASNRIVLRYYEEELILLRTRDNDTGKHIDIEEFLDKVGSIKIAPFEDNFKDLDKLIERSKNEKNKEGWVVQFENGHLIKVKCDWYMALHGTLTNDIYREDMIIEYIIDDKIDDILGQIPEEEIEVRDRIAKITDVVKKAISDKINSIEKSYKIFLDMGKNRKEYALKYQKTKNFAFVMGIAKGNDIYDMVKDWVKEHTKRLLMARNWLKERDPSLFFKDVPEELEES